MNLTRIEILGRENYIHLPSMVGWMVAYFLPCEGAFAGVRLAAWLILIPTLVVFKVRLRKKGYVGVWWLELFACFVAAVEVARTIVYLSGGLTP